jgi:hypothetical protein
VPNSKFYKIISDRKFENTLIQFIDWKTEMGLMQVLRTGIYILRDSDSAGVVRGSAKIIKQ